MPLLSAIPPPMCFACLCLVIFQTHFMDHPTPQTHTQPSFCLHGPLRFLIVYKSHICVCFLHLPFAYELLQIKEGLEMHSVVSLIQTLNKHISGTYHIPKNVRARKLSELWVGFCCCNNTPPQQKQLKGQKDLFDLNFQGISHLKLGVWRQHP